MPAPVTGTYPAFAENYVKLVHAENTKEVVDRYAKTIVSFFKNIPEGEIDYRYTPGKWSIKEMLGHIIDAERIFAYRALRIARHDKTPLPGFDENSYAAASNAAGRSWKSLLDEFEATRTSTDLMVLSFTDSQLEQTGITNDHINSVNAICFMLYGHILHHINVLKERYL